MECLFPGRVEGRHISARQYSGILKNWLCSVGLDPARTARTLSDAPRPTLIYKRTKNIRAIQLLLGKRPAIPFLKESP